ncbi:FYN-binding protein 1 [Pangasianodon hypophthalmus]|uniref:FYN-binding protein 1 n=1 Tax=Pangasianodon hypophthalmus TaxID=310915 RepID=UPI0023080BAE|nr:FYN-binding protein 1 [Pangasianodon hypophthalmus]
MEQGEDVKVKTLREKFQNDESLKIRIKPAIPEKPKTIPPVSPNTKISNPLIASINSAVENRLAPRVVFKDDKKNHQVSQPENSTVKAKPILLDKNQKKEADLIKQALKDKKIQPMSPVIPVLEQTPKTESIQKPQVLERPAKVSTPFKKSVFNKTDKDEKEKTNPSEWDVPATPVLDHSDSTISTPAKAEATVNKPLVPKALVPPVRANPAISAPVISPPAVAVSKPPALTVPEPVSQNGPQIENPRPEIPIRLNSNVTSPTADIFSNGLPKDPTSIPEISDILDMDIPPPIIPEDFSDGGTSVLDIFANVTPEHSFPGASLSVSPVSSSPALSRTDTPIPAIETPDSNAAFTFSPSPTFLTPSTHVKSMEENRVTESHKAIDHTEKPLEVPLSSSPKPISVVSALARAEEMTPVKHNHCDQRLLTLLEKAKRKSTSGSQSSTPEILPVLETDLPSNAPLEPPETAHAEPFSHVEVPNAPETLVTLPDFPPVDYENKAEEAPAREYNTQPYETVLNKQDHRKSSPAPKMVIVQRPTVPPPPPPRKPQSTVSNGGLTPEKPPQSPSTDTQSSILPSQPLEDNGIISAPADFTSEDSAYEDSEIWDPSETVGSQAEAPDYGNPGPSVHEEAFLEHLNLEHQTPNMDTADAMLPRTVTPEHSDSGQDSLFNPTLPSPSGKQLNYSSTELEDLAASKKSKTQKKQRKGSPMNPYADTPVVTEEIPKKALFSKKNSVSDEKELKSKEKQRQKDKEKEKEKEKEKKELKEKEKKEQKEKEKEQKDKKKEQKEKERDKKGLKEKEREKKEQKEKEKKENEIKKKFKITGEEEALYQAKVTETTKGRKDDLAIKAGEIVSIIRTTDCPKGKWLARDSTNKYGYIPVESVELNIQEMIVLGNKAKATNRASVNGITDPDSPSTDIISSPHYSLNQESFEDDSEEWGDDDESVFPPAHTTDLVLNQRVASPDAGPEPVPALPAHSDRTDNVQAGQEALHKLTTFFAQPKVPTLQNKAPSKEQEPIADSAEEPVSSLKQEIDLQLLPPPDLYADIIVG